VVSVADAQRGFSSPGPTQAYMSVRPGASVDEALARVDTAIADSPEVTVMTIDRYFAAQARMFDVILCSDFPGVPRGRPDNAGFPVVMWRLST
jgi:hypothetical protein